MSFLHNLRPTGLPAFIHSGNNYVNYPTDVLMYLGYHNRIEKTNIRCRRNIERVTSCKWKNHFWSRCEG